jgi:hypothetical protein
MRKGTYIRTPVIRAKISLANKGKKRTKKALARMKKAGLKRRKKGKLSPARVHWRIQKDFGKANHCEHCKKLGKKKYEWSNKNHKYSLNRKYWQQLCCSCHMIYDIENNLYRPGVINRKKLTYEKDQREG